MAKITAEEAIKMLAEMTTPDNPQPFYPNHRPSMKLSDYNLNPDYMIVWRTGDPLELMTRGGVIEVPDSVIDENRNKYKYAVNCAKVLMVGKNCERAKPGDYAFWGYTTDTVKEKVQPIAFQYFERIPNLFLLKDTGVILSVPSDSKETDGPYTKGDIIELLARSKEATAKS